MSMRAKTERLPRNGLKRAARFSTVAQFMDEYDRGSQLPIDLDPRVDFTKPVYQQIVALQRADVAANERADVRTKHSRRAQ